MSDEQPAIIPVVSVSGERGKTGDQGQDGHDGQDGRTGRAGRDGQTGRDGLAGLTGEAGQQGEVGMRGKPFSRLQAAVTFGLIALGLSLFIWMSEKQADRIEAQQLEIGTITNQLLDARYTSCVNNLRITKNFNAQYDVLISIERSLVNDPNSSDVGIRVGKARIIAYTDSKIPLDPKFVCVR